MDEAHLLPTRYILLNPVVVGLVAMVQRPRPYHRFRVLLTAPADPRDGDTDRAGAHLRATARAPEWLAVLERRLGRPLRPNPVEGDTATAVRIPVNCCGNRVILRN